MNLGDKILLSKSLIEEYAPYAARGGGYVVGFSGGKDSTVLHRLFVETGLPFRAQYNVTTIDPPENVRFIRENYPDVEFLFPKLNFFKLILKKKFLPTMTKRYCCSYFKENNHGFMALGIRREESVRRSKYDVIQLENKKKFDKNSYKGERVRFYPLLDWTEADVWEFIENRGLPVNPLYDTFGRVGCMLCPFANKKQIYYWLRKYPKLKVLLLKTIERIIAEGAYKDFNPTAEMVLEWYVSKENYTKFFTQLNLIFPDDQTK